MKEDIQFRLRSMMRLRIRLALKNNPKKNKTVELIGCSFRELKCYLEGKFKDGMTWENQGTWHIDHIIPLSFFDLTNDVQLKQACHYSNLQPLWAHENLVKSDKIPSYAKK